MTENTPAYVDPDVEALAHKIASLHRELRDANELRQRFERDCMQLRSAGNKLADAFQDAAAHGCCWSETAPHTDYCPIAGWYAVEESLTGPSPQENTNA